MVYGRYELIMAEHPEIYAFTRALEGERLLVLLNFSGSTALCELPAGLAFSSAEVLSGNYPAQPGEDARSFVMRPWEARVYRLG